LVHGNRLIKANIRTADELRDLWASPKAKDKLRKRNRNVELIPSYPENTNALDQYLQDNDDDDLPEPSDVIELPDIGQSLKRKQVFDEIVVERPPKRRSK
jgi:hypothetical protein